MKHILYILPVAERGGAERIVESWTAAHTEEFCPHVVLPETGSLQRSFKNLGVNVIVPPQFKMKNLVNSIAFLKDYIKTESIDLIHSSNQKGHLFGGLTSLLTGCKEIWYNHGPMSLEYYQGFIPLIPSSALLVSSNYMYELQKNSLYNSKRLSLAPCGINTDIIYSDQNNRSILREKYNLSSDAIAIGVFGRITRWKGQNIVLKAIRELKLEYPNSNFYCFIIGEALFGIEHEYKDELIQLTKDLDIKENVSFVGYVDNVYDYYDLVDVVVHASLIPEPFGLVVAEAMAKKKVVIATVGGGPSEMIEHNVTGFLYNPGDVKELAQILSSLFQSFNVYKANNVGEKARKSIEKNFSLKKSVKKLESIYLEVLNN